MGRGRCEAEIDTVYRFQAETGGRLPAAPGCDEGNVTTAPEPGLYCMLTAKIGSCRIPKEKEHQMVFFFFCRQQLIFPGLEDNKTFTFLAEDSAELSAAGGRCSEAEVTCPQTGRSSRLPA